MRASSLLVLLLSACHAPATESSSPAERQRAPTTGWTGVLSEEEFKALHVLREGAPPSYRGEMIELDGNRAYLVLPVGAHAPMPGVVVVHEWWGLNENVMHWADRIAAEGYAAIAVDLYLGQVATNPDQATALMKAVDPDVARDILRQAHRFLVDDSRVRAPRTGSIGWCAGGAWSLRLGLSEPDLDACVMYYGRPITDARELASLRAPLLCVFGSRDPSIPPDVVADFDEALTEAGKPHVIRMYDADHAFANPSSGRYDEVSAAAAWEEVRAFLARNLAPKP